MTFDNTQSKDNSDDFAVVVSNVSHRYGKVIQAIKNVSIAIPKSATIALVGPDGVGKSTLLSLIAGMKKIQTGTVQVLNKDMHNKKAREFLLNKVAFMPQGLGHNLYPTLSVFENIDFHARLFSIDKASRQARIERLLVATDLLKFKDRPAGKLSGGMKQKLSLCCALVHDPEADEAEAMQDAAKFARRVRKRLGLSQAEFSERIDVSLDTIRNWEQGKRSPTGAAKALLRVLDKAPELALLALH